MTLTIFQDWLKDLNRIIKAEDGKILLLLDSAPNHPKDFELSIIELFCFPPNSSSLNQSLDKGILERFKDYYKKFL